VSAVRTEPSTGPATGPPAAPPQPGGAGARTARRPFGPRGRRGRDLLANLTGIAAFLLFAFPVYWMVANSLKQPLDILSYPPKFLPWPLTLDHFVRAVSKPLFGTYLRNSLLVTLTVVLLSLTLGLLGALAVGRFSFRGRRAYLLAVLIVQMAPFEALLIPFFLMFRGLDLLNKLPGLILIYFIFTMPFTIWTLRGFVAAVPRELEEAAMVDGASRGQAFRRVVLPLLAPGLVATSIFAFVTAWNEFLYAYVFMEQDKWTLPVWIASFRTAFGTDWGGTMAASTLFTLPVLVFFLIIHRRLVSGLTAGSVKG
jgi:N,N'-diacetylchitobiose transport system permease protein